MSSYYFCRQNSRLFGVFALFLGLSFVNCQSTASSGYLTGCAVTLGSYYFNLKSLKRNSTEGDYIITYDNGDGDVEIDYNICEYTYTACDSSVDDYAHYTDENGDCYKMSGTDNEDIVASFIDETDPSYGLYLTYSGGDSCNDTSDYVLTLQLNCDDDADGEITYEIDTSTVSTPCTPTIIMTTAASCPSYSLGTLYTFFATYYYLFGVLLIIAGLFFMSVGGKFYRVTMFCAATFAVAAFLLIYVYLILYPTYSPMWLMWESLIVALGLGSGAGYAAQKWPKVGVVFIGIWVGGIFGTLFYLMIVSKFVDNYQALAIWISIAVFAIICSVVSLVFFDHAVIIGSATTGAYVFVRGIAVYAGGFLGEYLIYTAISTGSMSDLPKTVYIYLVSFLVLAVVSAVI